MNFSKFLLITEVHEVWCQKNFNQIRKLTENTGENWNEFFHPSIPPGETFENQMDKLSPNGLITQDDK